MDILIKNMEMPKGNTPLVLIINSDGSVDEIDCSDEINATDATAIALPPHGRLVSEDEIIAKMQDVFINNFCKDKERIVYEKLVKAILDAPTILEASK